MCAASGFPAEEAPVILHRVNVLEDAGVGYGDVIDAIVEAPQHVLRARRWIRVADGVERGAHENDRMTMAATVLRTQDRGACRGRPLEQHTDGGRLEEWNVYQRDHRAAHRGTVDRVNPGDQRRQLSLVGPRVDDGAREWRKPADLIVESGVPAADDDNGVGNASVAQRRQDGPQE